MQMMIASVVVFPRLSVIVSVCGATGLAIVAIAPDTASQKSAFAVIPTSVWIGVFVPVTPSVVNVSVFLIQSALRWWSEVAFAMFPE